MRLRGSALALATLFLCLEAGCAHHSTTHTTTHTSGRAGASPEPAPQLQRTVTTSGAQVYDYYPSQEVYFAPDRQVYFWPERGEWQHGSSLPGSIRLDSRERVTVPLYTDSPYRVHDSVTAAFPATRRAATVNP